MNAAERVVDVIVPVRRNARAATRCVTSILASRNETPYAVIALVDPEVEREFRASLREPAADARLVLVTTGRLLDYAGAIDRGLSAHTDRDVVLLQADAEVHGDWLDRLAAHADAADTGIVGTFTNVAGSATYPRPDTGNPLPEEATPALLDACFAATNARQSAAVAAVFGPCLYVKRACIAATGGLRSVASDDGYAAEVDFCLRAAGAGYRCVVAGDIFVANEGEGSFGNRARNVEGHAAMPALANLHPGQAPALRELAQNPCTRTLAGQVDLARLAASPRPAIVFVSHAWGGGIRRHMDELAALARPRADVLYLEPANADTVKLHWPRQGEAFTAWFRLPGDLPVLAGTLREIGVARLHFHHVHGLPRSILELPQAAGIAYDCTLHDYFAICPQYHLADERGRYCGEPDATGCAACIARRPGQWDLDIGTWRGVLGGFLRGAQRVIAPSQDVATRMRRYLPALAIDVWPHPEAAAAQAPAMTRVITLGNLSPEKGLHVVAACAEDARARALPLTFRVLGATTAQIAQSPEAPLTIHGSYPEERLPHLLAAERADVLFFPAQVPETYSYTLSAALATDVPIVAAAIGAFTERLAGRARVRLLPFDADAAQWNAALIDAAREAPAPPVFVPAKGDAPVRATS
jgi:glycosyltransferase involved in cell wall biosynthesis/GT2 family glycosyltransferase